MGWTGKLVGAVIGFLASRSFWGALTGLFIGHLFDEWLAATPPAGSARRADGGRNDPWGTDAGGGGAPGGDARPISAVFFRTTFELMGHVAKSDGRVSEAEIDAARRLMGELQLAPPDVALAIAAFRAGKSATYQIESSIERLREACALRHDLLRAFLELQLRAALFGNGLSPPARAILIRVAETLGLSGLEFAFMEAAARGRQQWQGGRPGSPSAAKSLDACYAELEVNASMSDPEITKAYRRQMSRHHPDKLVANGLPDSMAQLAKEKTQRIQEAYESIRAARGMR